MHRKSPWVDNFARGVPQIVLVILLGFKPIQRHKCLNIHHKCLVIWWAQIIGLDCGLGINRELQVVNTLKPIYTIVICGTPWVSAVDDAVHTVK